MKKSKIRRRLQKSLDNRRIATVVRDDFDLRSTSGFVIALTQDWVVVHALNAGVYLDEVAFLRLQDVSKVWFRDDDAYHHRAVDDLGQSTATVDCPDDADVRQMLSIASAHGDVLAVYTEVVDDDALFVGRLIKLRKKSFDLHFVGRDGVWVDELDRHRYKDVTRIEVGGRYLDALSTYADPYPEAPTP